MFPPPKPITDQFSSSNQKQPRTVSGLSQNPPCSSLISARSLMNASSIVGGLCRIVITPLQCFLYRVTQAL